MTYRVFDDKFENSTTLVIEVLDVNDNPPQFDNAVYNVLDLNEEEPGISKSSPKYLLTVMSHFFGRPYFAIATLCRPSVCRLFVAYVLWLNGTS